MLNRKLIGAAAFSAALAGGAVAGSLLGTPGLSAAEVTLTSPDSADGADSATAGDHRGPGRFLALEVAAEALGISEDDLRDRLEDGETIAAIAEAEGVDLQTVIDALVDAGTQRIDQWAAEAKEALPERVAEAVERDWTERGPGHGPFRR